MDDYSYLDKQYFIDGTVYNCPFCNRNNVRFVVDDKFNFDWTIEKACHGFIVICSSCGNRSMHLTYNDIVEWRSGSSGPRCRLTISSEIDSKIFYSVPTSFFVIDSRIPKTIRELITEAEGCLKMNHLTGASACMRKAIYELLIKEEVEGEDYESKIKFLKKKYHDSDPNLFDILSHIQDMTSDKIHEQSWPKWDSRNLNLIIETLKTILYDIYVLPQIKKDRSIAIAKMRKQILEDKKSTNPS